MASNYWFKPLLIGALLTGGACDTDSESDGSATEVQAEDDHDDEEEVATDEATSHPGEEKEPIPPEPMEDRLVPFDSPAADADAKGLTPKSIPVTTQEKQSVAETIRFPVDDVAGSKWTHTGGSGYHRPHGGYNKANDTFALDLNIAGDLDKGKPVKAVLSGTVVQRYDSLGWILIRSSCSYSFKGQSYSTCYHGYMHMLSIPASVKVGAGVSQSAQLGVVGNAGTTPNHLHFGFYAAHSARTGEINSSSRNGFLESINPGPVLGGPYANFNLASNVEIQYVDDQTSNATFNFSTAGTAFKKDSAYGWFGGMTYRASTNGGTDKAIYDYKEGVPNAGKWGAWAFIPRNHGTATVPYKIYRGTTLLASGSINQASYSDQFVSILGYEGSTCSSGVQAGKTMSLNKGDKLRIEVLSNAGVTGKEVAFDDIHLVQRYANCNQVISK